jgi:hypothetical protein
MVVRVQVKAMTERLFLGGRGVWVVLGAVVAAACAGSTQTSPPPDAPAEPVAPDVAAPESAPTVAANDETTAGPEPEAAPAVKLLTWSRELEVSASMLALGKKRIAVLESGASAGRYRGVRMRDLAEGAEWSDLKLPERLLPTRAQREHLEVFFGRDDRPRLMGTRYEGEAATPRYYRYKDGWRDRTGEIARLEGGTGTLFGILGHDDPEVVCKLGEHCIIKRVTGWTNVAVPLVEHHVEIAGGNAFAVAPDSALRVDLGDKAWRSISRDVPWQEPLGLWPFADGTLWVADGSWLHHWDGQRWRTVDSPLPGARALWGRAANDVWLAAAGGVGHFDGEEWSRLVEPTGDFAHVIGTSDAVWVAGASGVWIGR